MMAVKDPAALNNEGNALYDSGKFEEAIQCYDKAIQIDSNYVAAWRNKGLVLRTLKKFDEALRCYDEAIRIDPNYVDAWNDKATTFLDLGKAEEAVEYYDKAIAIDPNYSWAWRNKGLALRLLEKYEEAFHCHEEAIRIDPNYVDAWNEKGNTLLDLGRPEKAIECYDKAIKIDPSYLWAWSNKGFALSAVGSYAEAESCYEHALGLEPRSIDVLAKLNTLYSEELYNYKKALDITTLCLEIDPTLDVQTNHAENLIKAGKFPEGRKQALHALSQIEDKEFKCILRFYIVCSYLLEANTVHGDKALGEFLEFYQGLGKDFKVEEKRWSFKGLIKVIKENKSGLQVQFMLLVLLDLMQGRIDRDKLSFSQS